MSKYAEIDAAITDSLIGSPADFNQLYRGRVLRLLRETTGDASVVLHSRLCAMKKQGKIEFKDRKWCLVQERKND